MSARSGPAFETSTRDGKDWRDDAACRDHPTEGPETWFPIGITGGSIVQIVTAKNVCWTECPVRRECDQFAENAREDSGIWGGLDENERKQRRRRKARARQDAARQGN